MKEHWQKNIESFSEKEFFEYLTIDRGIYQEEAINYAEKILKGKNLTIIGLQKKYKYNQKSVESEIIKRINSGESIQEIEQNFIERKLEQYIYLIKKQKSFLKKIKKSKTKKSKIIFNIVLSLIFSFIFLVKNVSNTVNIYQILSALMVPTLTPFILGLAIELFKKISSKEHKFQIFSDLFVKIWYYFILFLYATLFLFR